MSKHRACSADIALSNSSHLPKQWSYIQNYCIPWLSKHPLFHLLNQRLGKKFPKDSNRDYYSELDQPGSRNGVRTISGGQAFVAMAVIYYPCSRRLFGTQSEPIKLVKDDSDILDWGVGFGYYTLCRESDTGG